MKLRLTSCLGTRDISPFIQGLFSIFQKVLKYSPNRSYISSVRFISRYFIVIFDKVNYVFKIVISNSLLLECTKSTDFGILLLQLALPISYFFPLSLFFFGRTMQLVGSHLVPRPGIESGPSAVRVHSPNHWTAREFPIFFNFIEVQLIYNIVLVSGIQQSGSALFIYIYIYI